MAPSATADNRNSPLTVTQLNRRARLTIEQEFAQVWVVGELSNFARPRSGHWYFTLKDEQAQVRCAMFANRNRAVQLQPRDGHLVMVRGRVSLYEGRGDFQIIVEHMEAAGEGALRQAFDQLKVKLAAEGLFEQARKQPLPDIPRHVAVVTSPSGAALRDILAVWRRRFPVLRVTVVPALVQGSAAEADLIRALRQAQALAPDAILLSRGGGSLEDLWSFNLESVARAIADCTVPVVSGVGHEIDITIADYVADMRGPTPSAAAEIMVPDGDEMQQVLTGVQSRLYKQWRQQHHVLGLTLDKLRLQLRTPEHIVNQAAQNVDDLAGRLHAALAAGLERRNTRLQLLGQQIHSHGPQAQLQLAQLQAGQLTARLHRSMTGTLQKQRQVVAGAARMLQSVSPLPTLGRGYALVRNNTGHLVSDIEQVEDGQTVTTHVRNGTFTSVVNGISDTPPFTTGSSDQQT